MNTQNRIVIAGDWHASTGWALRCLKFLSAQGIKEIVHVGDFGIGFYPAVEYIDPVNAYLAAHDMAIIIVPGNHENWEQINALSIETDGTYAGFQALASNLHIAPRGHRWQMGALSFVGLGGGNSIDFRRRIQGRDWWREEAISEADLYRTIAGGHADVMIAHVAPFNAVYELSSMGWDAAAVRYSDESRMVMGYAVDAVKPDLFFHGHYHVAKRQVVTAKDEQGTAYTTEYISLGMNDQPNNLAYFDLNTREVEFIRYPF